MALSILSTPDVPTLTFFLLIICLCVYHCYVPWFDSDSLVISPCFRETARLDKQIEHVMPQSEITDVHITLNGRDKNTKPHAPSNANKNAISLVE